MPPDEVNEIKEIKKTMGEMAVTLAVIKAKLDEVTPHHPPCFELKAATRDLENLWAAHRELKSEIKQAREKTASRIWDVLKMFLPWLVAAAASAAFAAKTWN